MDREFVEIFKLRNCSQNYVPFQLSNAKYKDKDKVS